MRSSNTRVWGLLDKSKPNALPPAPSSPHNSLVTFQSTVNVYPFVFSQGHELPVALPLSELPGPNAAPKQTKPNDLEPASKPPKPERLHTQPHPRAASHERQQPLKAHAQEQEPAQQASQEATVQLHRKVSKEVANKVLTKLESTLPVHVVTDKQKRK